MSLYKYTAIFCLLIFSLMPVFAQVDIGLIEDPAPENVTGKFKKGSHIKLFLPNLPFLAISHSINAALVRPANNIKGWEYDLAVSHTHTDDNKVFEFTLNKGVQFQDGTPFNADSVVLNMEHFKLRPFTYTNLYQIFDRVEKINDYRVRFYLTEPNGVFLHDLTHLPFYSETYLNKFGWNGKDTAANLAEAGPYGLGPYILSEGYLEGDRSTPKVVLKANLNYWGQEKPKVETITIYNSLTMEEAINLTLHNEGEIDITPIPFANEVETVLSSYAKLHISPSTNSYAMHFNLINGRKAILDDRIRYAINHSIDKESLLNLSMLGEGVLAPTMLSPQFYKVSEAIAELDDFFQDEKSKFKDKKSKNDYLRTLVTEFQLENNMDPNLPLEIHILTQESFLFLVRDIQYFLSEINIDLVIDVVDHEKVVLKQLFETHLNKNEMKWDILLWANYDWFRHPWSAFFVYRPNHAWSSLPNNPLLDQYVEQILAISEESDEYIPLISSFIRYVYTNNYMLFLPNPNVVYAVNKEVVFHPRTSAIVPLWELEVTDLHWSLRRDKEYPEHHKKPYQATRFNFK